MQPYMGQRRERSWHARTPVFFLASLSRPSLHLQATYEVVDDLAANNSVVVLVAINLVGGSAEEARTVGLDAPNKEAVRLAHCALKELFALALPCRTLVQLAHTCS